VFGPGRSSGRKETQKFAIKISEVVDGLFVINLKIEMEVFIYKKLRCTDWIEVAFDRN
jgi:hypothetical protein